MSQTVHVSFRQSCRIPTTLSHFPKQQKQIMFKSEIACRFHEVYRNLYACKLGTSSSRGIEYIEGLRHSRWFAAFSNVNVSCTIHMLNDIHSSNTRAIQSSVCISHNFPQVFCICVQCGPVRMLVFVCLPICWCYSAFTVVSVCVWNWW